MLLYADDILLFNETAKDMQSAIIATLSYFEEHNMCINIGKTKYKIFSRGKVRKGHAITVYGQTIEGVDTFCYLGIVFIFDNTFEAARKQNIDGAKKVLFKIEILLNRVDLQVKTRLNLFDSLILRILLHGYELWGYENMEPIEVSYRKFLRRMLKIRENTPKAMVYRELGRFEIRFTVWN